MRRWAFFLVLVAVVAGCEAGDEWTRGAVQGEITLDGQPVPQGQITFFPAGDNSGPAAGSEIIDGKYEIDESMGPVVGRNRVEIRSVQKTGRLVKSPVAVEADGVPAEGMMVEEFLEVVPKKYNTYSELDVNVVGDQVNEFNFGLSSKN